LGYWPYYGYSYPYYAYDYGYPDYYSSYPDTYSYQYATPQYYGSYTPEYTLYQAPATETTANVRVIVPPTATVWVEGQQMTQTGNVRDFVSPALPSGQPFIYHVRATWMQNGAPVTQGRAVDVQAGAQVTVNFLTPAKPAPGDAF
jgi:uncharacterized protein (TIGR03000 family)